MKWNLPSPYLACYYSNCLCPWKNSIASRHQRLGHPSSKVVNCSISSFSLPTNLCHYVSNICHSCAINKAQQLPFHKHGHTSKALFDLIYTDVWGPSPSSSLNGHRYYVIFIDHFAKYVWFFPLHQKSDVKTIFPHFLKMIETRYDTKIKGVYFNNGGEFLVLRPFFKNHGISHYTTLAHPNKMECLSISIGTLWNRPNSSKSCISSIRILALCICKSHIFDKSTPIPYYQSCIPPSSSLQAATLVWKALILWLSMLSSNEAI